MSEKTKSLLLLHFVIFLFGFTGILGKLISLNSYDLVFYRVLMAFPVLLIFVLLTKRFKFQPKMFFSLIGIGVITALHWLTFFESIKLMNVSIALACLSSASFFTALLEPLILKTKVNKKDLLLGLLVISGVCIMFKTNSGTVLGISIALVSAFLAALFTVLNGQVIKHHAPSLISMYEMLGGILLLIPILLIKDGGLPALPQGDDWLWMVILSVLCTAFAFVAAVRVMKHISPFTVALSVNLEPIYAIVLAFIIFKEHQDLGFNFYLGASIIFVAVFAKGLYRQSKKLFKFL